MTDIRSIRSARLAVAACCLVGLLVVSVASGIAFGKGEGIEATVTGENICLGCTLEKERGAAAQCDKYGHRHALRVTGATAAGKDLPELKGCILHYLETDKARPFITEHRGETLVLMGKIYVAERVLEVDGQVIPKRPEHPEHPK